MNSAIRKANKKLGVTFNDSVGDSFKKVLSQSINAETSEDKKAPLRELLLLVDDMMYNLANDYVKIINKHNSNRQYARTEHAINNSVVSRVKQIISDPTSQILANAPVDVQILHEAINDAVKLDPEESKINILSPHDMFSMYKQQHDASVGKADVGIAANGLKAFFALSSYYNDYYANKFEGDETAVRRSFKTFEKRFEFIGADGKSKVYSPGAISDVKINKRQKNLLMATLANPEFYNEEAALLLSSFTSAATDNAKELIMAQVNATEELASMHIYLMILGFNANQVVEIMTSDTMKAVIQQLNVNMLQPDSKKSMVSRILSDLASSVDEDSSDLVNIKTMIDIYQAAQELKTLAKFLGINQKVTANTEEIFNYLQTFDVAFLTREHTIFGQDVKKILE